MNKAQPAGQAGIIKYLALLHPVLFSAASVIIFYLDRWDVRIYTSPGDVILPGICLIFSSLLIALIVYILSKRVELASLTSSLFILGFLYLWPHFFAIIILVILSLLVFKLVVKRVRLAEVNFALTLVSLFFFGYYLVRFVNFYSSQTGHDRFQFSTTVIDSQTETSTTENLPDIYFIILDGYGRADMLQSIFGFDNSEFIAALQQRGFIVTSGSQSNYSGTLLSLSSTLNMQYLEDMSSYMGDSSFWWPAEAAIKHSLVRSYLEELGYRTVFLASGWNFTSINDGDVFLKPYPLMLGDFSRNFISSTNLRVFSMLDWPGVYMPSYDSFRQVILFPFEQIPEIVEMAGPKFIFSHILSPHPPYVFNELGEPVDESIPFTLNRPNLPDDKQHYVEQLTYINRKTLDMIDAILENSETPPIIILQGDHGSNIYLDLNNMDATCLYERYSILSAFHLPGINAENLPQDISPVNDFRKVFNIYFGTHFDILPDRRYFSFSDAEFYHFRDITSLTESAMHNSGQSMMWLFSLDIEPFPVPFTNAMFGLSSFT